MIVIAKSAQGQTLLGVLRMMAIHGNGIQWQKTEVAILLEEDPGHRQNATQIINHLEERRKSRLELENNAFIGYGFSSKLDDERIHADVFLRAVIWQILNSSQLNLAQKRSIVQIYQRQPFQDLPQFRKSGRTQSASALPLLLDVLFSSLALFEASVLVIDGIDECPDHEEFLEILLRNNSLGKARVKWIFTSQKLVAINNALKEIPKVDMDSANYRNLTKETIRGWVEDRLTAEKAFSLIVDNLKIIRDGIVGKCDDMFLWAVAATEELIWKLKNAEDTASIDVFMATLEKLPSSLDWLLVYLIERITKYDPKLDYRQNEERKESLKVILRWAFHSIRPISTSELQDILAFSNRDGVNNEAKLTMGKRFRLETIELWINMAYPLIIEKNGRIQLMHATFKDIIRHADVTSPKISELLQLSQLQSQMTMQCLQYLLQPEFEFYSFIELDKTELAKSHQFLGYARINWIKHFGNLETVTQEVEEIVVSFLNDDNALTWLDSSITSGDWLTRIQSDVNIAIPSLAQPTWCIELLERVLLEYQTINTTSKRSLELSSILASIYDEKGQYVKAEKLYKDMVDYYGPPQKYCVPQAWRPSLNLAVVHLHKGELRECETALGQMDAYLEAISAKPWHRERIELQTYRISLQRQRGNYLEAYKIAKKMYEKRKRWNIAEDRIRTTLQQMSFALDDLGRYLEAKECIINAIKMHLHGTSPADQQTVATWLSSEDAGLVPEARVLNNLPQPVYSCLTILSSTEDGLGNFGKSLEIDQAVYNYRQKAYGMLDSQTILAKANLIARSRDGGNYEEVTKTFEETLVVSRQIVGEEHELSLALLGYLANNYHARGKYNAALQLHTKSRDLRAKLFGVEHPASLVSTCNIGYDLISLDREAEALEVLIPTLNIFLAKLGRTHHVAGSILSNIALACARLNRLALSEWIYRTLIEDFRDVLEESNFSYLLLQGNLAALLRVRGKLAESLRILRRVVSLLSKKYRPSNNYCVDASHSLARTLRSYGRHSESRSIVSKTLKIAKDTYGSNSPQVFGLEAQLALNDHDLGKWEESYKRHRDLHSRAVILFGESSSHTIDVQLHMGLAKSASTEPEDLKEAMELVEAAKDNLSLSKSKDGHEMIYNEELRGRIYFRQEKYEAAMDIQLKVLSKRRSLFGNIHHKTCDAYMDLGVTILKQGYEEQATSLLQTARSGYLTIFGKEHARIREIDSLLDGLSASVTSSKLINPRIEENLNQTIEIKTEEAQALEEAILTFGEDYSLILPPKINALSVGNTPTPQQILDSTMLRLEDCLKRFEATHSRSLDILTEIVSLSQESSTAFVTPLLNDCVLWAIEADDPELLKAIITAGANRSCLDSETNLSPLGFATQQHRASSVKVLLDSGFDVDFTESTGQNSLDIAIQFDATSVVPVLLSAHPDINRLGAYGRPPLQNAIILQREQIVETLISAGVSLYNDKSKYQAIHWATTSKNKRLVAMLLDAGADIDAKVDNGSTPMSLAIREGDLEMVKFLVSRGAALDCRIQYGTTYFQIACLYGNIAVAELLLQMGTNLNHSADDGWQAVHFAAYGGSVEIMKFLQTHHLDINAQKESGDKYTTLGFAAEEGHNALVNWLLEHGSDPNTKMRNGATALHLAAGHGHIATVRQLLLARADPNAQRELGLTPLSSALEGGFAGIGMLILEHGGTISTQELANMHLTRAILKEEVNVAVCVLKDGKSDMKQIHLNMMTNLHIAAYTGNTEMVSLLLDKGLDMKAQDFRGQTPLHIAAFWRHTSVIELLISRGAEEDALDCFGRRPIDWIDGSEECLKAFGISGQWNRSEPDVSKVGACIARFVKRLREDNAPVAMISGVLGTGFFLLGNIKDGVIAYEQTITTDKARSDYKHEFHCQLCSKVYIPLEGPMYMCKLCMVLKVCETCYIKNDCKPTHRVCSHMNLVKIPRDEWKDFKEGVVDSPEVTLEDWAARLEREYSEYSDASQASQAMDQATDQAIERKDG